MLAAISYRLRGTSRARNFRSGCSQYSILARLEQFQFHRHHCQQRSLCSPAAWERWVYLGGGESGRPQLCAPRQNRCSKVRETAAGRSFFSGESLRFKIRHRLLRVSVWLRLTNDHVANALKIVEGWYAGFLKYVAKYQKPRRRENVPDSEDNIGNVPNAPSGKVQIGIARPKTSGEAPKIFLHAEQGEGKILFMFSINEGYGHCKKAFV